MRPTDRSINRPAAAHDSIDPPPPPPKRKQGHEIYERGPNYYQQLQVARSSTPLEIKKAYKKQSLELHPDKNKSPTATEDFARVKSAYDVSLDVLDCCWCWMDGCALHTS